MPSYPGRPCYGSYGFTSPWSPILIPGMVAWWSADQQVYSDAGITLASTSGTLVQQWNDLSGNGNHLVQTSSQFRPTYQSTGFNGLPAISFLSSIVSGAVQSEWMKITNPITFNGATTFTVVCVYSNTTTNGGGTPRLASFAAPAQNDIGTNSFELGRNSAGNFGMITNNFSGNNYQVNLAVPSNQRIIIVNDGIKLQLYSNGVWNQNVNGTGSSAINTQTTYSSGVFHVSTENTEISSFLDCPIAEMILYATGTNSVQINNLDLYLKNHWGL